jgi:hypothetical protein
MMIMRRYVVSFAMFLFAIGAPLAGIIIWQAGRFDALATPAQLADKQVRRPETIILPVDLRYNGAFKLARVAEVQPDIVAFGSSRAGGFLAAMFAPHRFYNLSFTAWTTEQMLDIFERTTRAAHPRVAILELDYFLFADRWDQWYGTARTMIHGRPFQYAKTSLGNFLHTAVTNRNALTTHDSASSVYVGPQSILSREGFRNDGSYVYSEGHIADAQRKYRTIESFNGQAPPGPAVSRKQQQPIVRLAELARQRGIKLVAVQLPYIRAAIDMLEHDEAYQPNAGTWRGFESEPTRRWLADLGIPLFDLARSPIDDDLDNFVDAFHLTAGGMDKAMRELESDPAFRAAIDPDGSNAAVPPAP